MKPHIGSEVNVLHTTNDLINTRGVCLILWVRGRLIDRRCSKERGGTYWSRGLSYNFNSKEGLLLDKRCLLASGHLLGHLQDLFLSFILTYRLRHHLHHSAENLHPLHCLHYPPLALTEGGSCFLQV